MQSSLTSKGQTTVPKEVRDYLKLKPGAKVKWFFHPDGHVVVLPIIPASALRGIIPYSGRSISVEEMDPAYTGARPRKRREKRK